LSIAVLAVQRWLLGDSMFALRLLPALLGAATVAVVMLLARQLGGGRWAMALAGTAVRVSPIALAFGTTYSMNAFDLLVWATAGLLLARLIERSTARDWIALGAVLGVGLLNKTGVLWLGGGLLVAVLCTPLRAALRTRWPWLAAALALLLFSPYVLWNAAHDFAHLEFIRNAVAGKYSGLSVGSFLAGQLLIHNPAAAPLWLGGLIFLLAGGGRRHRAVAVVVVRPRDRQVAARRAAEAEVDAAGIDGGERPELLGDLVGRVVRQHDPAGADADRPGRPGDVADQDRGRGGGDAGHVVVLGHPVAVVAPLLGVPGEVDGVGDRLARVAALGHRGEVEDGVVHGLPLVAGLFES
jgi:hypothetical protein